MLLPKLAPPAYPVDGPTLRMPSQLTLRSVLLGLAIGAGGLLLIGAGAGDTYPRYELSRPWGATNEQHGIYMIDTMNGQVTSIVGENAHRVPEAK